MTHPYSNDSGSWVVTLVILRSDAKAVYTHIQITLLCIYPVRHGKGQPWRV